MKTPSPSLPYDGEGVHFPPTRSAFNQNPENPFSVCNACGIRDWRSLFEPHASMASPINLQSSLRERQTKKEKQKTSKFDELHSPLENVFFRFFFDVGRWHDSAARVPSASRKLAYDDASRYAGQSRNDDSELRQRVCPVFVLNFYPLSPLPSALALYPLTC